ncbi:MAG: type II toxin-antitoxin system HicB family antitoxin [Deltaproteobacteria bacterium]|nr:type II toxin-antitoxin system HicB family antitoxin [Deltaproteobacteria bacterium]
MNFSYPAKLSPDPEDGGFVVSFRDLPEAITQGDTPEACVQEAEGALEAALEYRIGAGLEIPMPSPAVADECMVSVPVHTALKAALYLALREMKVSKSELARRLDLNEKEARRILDPHHPTKTPTLERALHALGKKISVQVWSGDEVSSTC